MTITEYAELNNIPYKKVWKWLKRGKIPAGIIVKKRIYHRKDEPWISKKCTKCEMICPIEYFYPSTRDGYISLCKNCCAKNSQNYRKNNKIKNSLRNKKYYEETKEIFKEKRRKIALESYHRRKEKILLKRREKRRLGLDDREREHQRKWRKNRYKTNPSFRISLTLRSRISDAIKSAKTYKAAKTEHLLGMSIDGVKKYLETLWLPGMSWENYGYYGWHIDHILPCNSFDLTKPEEQMKCFNYKNLQPMWAKDNFSKNKKIIIDYQI